MLLPQASPTTSHFLFSIHRSTIRLINNPAFLAKISTLAHRPAVGEQRLYYRYFHGIYLFGNAEIDKLSSVPCSSLKSEPRRLLDYSYPEVDSWILCIQNLSYPYLMHNPRLSSDSSEREILRRSKIQVPSTKRIGTITTIRNTIERDQK